MTDKVFFMPFDPRRPEFVYAQFEYGATKGGIDKNQIQIDHELAKGHRAISVWWQPGKKNPFLAGLSDGQIYIRGHGMPGYKSIEGGRGGERVDYDEVVDRLLQSGLRKTFAGKIKCYSCHSAEFGDTAGSMDREQVGTPFAQLVADELYARGVRNCTVFGYWGAIDSFVKDGSEGRHKYVRVKKVVDGRMQQVEYGRASEARYQFVGRPRPKKPGLLQRLFR
ncbi:hypothetical protein FK498_03325 [Elioraea sp. Yellowstone]|uniref:hypothetical protein n=1 Tax=Elioraea sp. Yellowstone TaxID=2592070 RepID=UPI00114FF132|nr:hypothetical protein [Elioraea sp. Yellowstone]TQF83087.1 hypothetical protein FK498_03325 [Elioraea sp. Yellowstone]